MKPENRLDWIAFILLLTGAFSWGYFVTDINILDVLLEKIWDPLDDIVFVLIALAGVYWIIKNYHISFEYQLTYPCPGRGGPPSPGCMGLNFGSSFNKASKSSFGSR